MPYKTPSGDCYHSVEGCYGAMEPCPAGGRLAPCSICHGRGEGVIAGSASPSAGGTGGLYEEDLPGAYARKYANSIEGYPGGMFKTADGIIRNRHGHKMSEADIKACLDDATRLRDEQLRRINRYSRPNPEDADYLMQLDYLGQLELQVQCLQAAYSDAKGRAYGEKFWSAKSDIPPIEPDTQDESFYEKRGVSGYIPKLLKLHDAYGQPFEVSSTRLVEIANASLAVKASAAYCEQVDMSPEWLSVRRQQAYERWQQVPPSERPQLWHVQPLLGLSWTHDDRALQTMCAYVGIGDSVQEIWHMEDMVKAVSSYCGASFADMKRSQQGEQSTEYLKRTAALTEEYIARAPKWAGGPTYRGMMMTTGQVADIMRAAEENGEFHPTMGTLGSWSTDSRVGRKHALDESKRKPEKDRTIPVLFECGTQSKGTSIVHLSPPSYKVESEVLVSKDARYRVAKVRKGNDGVLHVLLEEITD